LKFVSSVLGCGLGPLLLDGLFGGSKPRCICGLCSPNLALNWTGCLLVKSLDSTPPPFDDAAASLALEFGLGLACVSAILRIYRSPKSSSVTSSKCARSCDRVSERLEEWNDELFDDFELVSSGGEPGDVCSAVEEEDVVAWWSVDITSRTE
jgi:hypothetical protein